MSDRPTRVVNAKVMRYVWDTGWSGGSATPPWPDLVFAEIFQADNGWSLRDYWRRCTFGHLEVNFDIGPWAVLPGASHRELHADRRAIVAACRAQAAADRVSLEHFEHLVAFVHEPPCDTGPSGRDVVLDQAPVTLEFYQRSIGRMLGFSPRTAIRTARWAKAGSPITRSPRSPAFPCCLVRISFAVLAGFARRRSTETCGPIARRSYRPQWTMKRR